MIKKVSATKYIVVSEKSGRKLSKPVSKAQAKRRLAQVEAFKRRDAKGLLG